jgi:hypothetical protein
MYGLKPVPFESGALLRRKAFGVDSFADGL